MLDCDNQEESIVVDFAREYAEFHGLGSSLVMKTSVASPAFSGRRENDRKAVWVITFPARVALLRAKFRFP